MQNQEKHQKTFICIHFPDLLNIFHPIDLSFQCAVLGCGPGLGWAGQMRCLMCDPVMTPD